MMRQKGCMATKIYAMVVVVIAAILSLLLFTLPIEQIDHAVIFIKFFESMLPILAVGGLIKYLWSSKKSCCYCGTNCRSNMNDDSHCGSNNTVNSSINNPPQM